VIGKLLDVAEVAEIVEDGMTIGIGGWGSRRKPMTLLKAVIRSQAKDLTIVSFGGPDVGMLCATGQAATVVHGFVTLDSIAIEPHFAAARQNGSVDTVELDEAMMVAGLRAAAHRLPFEITRSGLGSDALTRNAGIHTITSPYDDGEVLVAMPALRLDLALIHLHRSDERGNAQCLGPDPYFDDLFAMAAARTIVSVEEVVETVALTDGAPPSTLLLNRSLVHGVVHAPHGAGFTSCEPDYGRDEAVQRAYADAAASPAAWADYAARHLDRAGGPAADAGGRADADA
jgi:glutaconate CoA-transferase, subunit A